MGISSTGGGLAPITLREALAPQETQQTPQTPTGSHTSVAGQGGLADRTLLVGYGREREATLSFGDKALNFMGKLAQGLGTLLAGAVALGVTLASYVAMPLVPTMVLSNRSLERGAEATFKNAHAGMVRDLSTPRQDSILDKPGVMQKLIAHATSAGRNVTEAEIRSMVATGEHISEALQGPGGDQLPLKVRIGDNEHTVPSGVYTARACSWFMMAQAASQDVDREIALDDSMDTDQTLEERLALQARLDSSDMATEGAFVMKDPGNRMYNFLNSAPTACSRMSTHFEERVGHTEKHKFLGIFTTSKPAQRGIEDYQNKMPGNGGTMLFDKLKDGEMFVKFEHGGCPPFFKKEPHEGVGHAFCRFFAALNRNVAHGLEFISTRLSSPPKDAVVRQEHAYKGVMNESVNPGFKRLIKDAIAAGVIVADAGTADKMVKKHGLPYLREAVAAIKAKAQLEPANPAIQAQALELEALIASETARLGFSSDKHGIQRRGAEVHISLAVPPAPERHAGLGPQPGMQPL